MVRLPGLDQPVFSDEYYPQFIIADGVFADILFADDAGHPPLYIWTYWLSSLMFGNSTAVFRIVSLVFSLLSLLLLYKIAGALFDARTALFSVLLMGFSAWHIIFSTQIHIDAPFLTFFYCLLFWLMIVYREQPSAKNAILFGVCFMLALFTKLTAVLFLPILLVFALSSNFRKRDYYRFGVSILVAVVIFGLFYTVAQLQQSLVPVSVKTLSNDYLAFNPFQSIDYVLLLIHILFAFIFMSPTFLSFIVLQFRQDKDGRHWILITWALIIVLFYLILIKGTERSFERWWITALPPLAILGSRYMISKNVFSESRHWVVFLSSTVLFTIMFSLLNFNKIFLPFYPKHSYITSVLMLKNVQIPITGSAGPLGFYFSTYIVLAAFIICSILLMAHIFVRSPKVSCYLFLIFLSCSFAFNILLVSGFSFGTPDFSKTTAEMVSYARSTSLDEPIVTFRNGAIYDIYLRDMYDHHINVASNQENDRDLIGSISGTVLLVDFPKSNRQSLLWSRLSKCTLLRSFSSGGFETGFIFSC